MQTKTVTEYKAVPYGQIATIPQGTPVIEATNLPPEDGKQYWAEAWEGMDEQAELWHRNYGFLLSADEVGPDENELEKTEDGNCLYCGARCFEGQMCDEQQAGGFNA